MFADVFLLRDKMHLLEHGMGNAQENELACIMEDYAKATDEYERAGGFSCETNVRRITSGLGFSDEDLGREVNSFSGGEKTRASLARLLVKEPDILLLDEPTNHLDLEAVEWLEAYLKDYTGAVLLISHDRYFLDQVADKMLEMEHCKLEQYPGNYSRYLVLKEERLFARTRAFDKQQKEIETTEEYINKYRAGIKSKQARGRQSQLNRLERLSSPESSVKLNLQGVGRQVAASGNVVLEVKDLSFGFAEKRLLDHVSLSIHQGEKTALIGGNGVGKSTLLKIITEEITLFEGEAKIGSRVKIGYYDQEHASLDKNKRVIDELMYNFGMPEGEARDYLGAFLFREDDVFKYVRDLSGGERGRVAFLKLFLTNPNFLILDEPTNHLSIASKDIIESYLQDFSGTVLMVSHDRYFIDKVADRTLDLAKGTITSYLGNYSYYKEKKSELLRKQQEKASQPKPLQKEKEVQKPKINKAKTRERILSLENEIEDQEVRLKGLAELLAEPVTYQDEEKAKQLLFEYKALEEKIPKTYEEWEALNELLNEG